MIVTIATQCLSIISNYLMLLWMVVRVVVVLCEHLLHCCEESYCSIL